MGILRDIELKVAESEDRQKVCKMGLAMMAFSPEDRAAVEVGIDKVRKDRERPQHERFFTVEWLHDVLVNNGFPMGKTVVSQHIRKACACEQSGQ